MPRARNSAAAGVWADSDEADIAVARSLQHDDLSFFVRHHLSREQRLIVMLRYAEELGFDEIAAIMALTQDEVEVMHQDIVGRLKKAMKPPRRQSRPRCLASST